MRRSHPGHGGAGALWPTKAIALPACQSQARAARPFGPMFQYLLQQLWPLSGPRFFAARLSPAFTSSHRHSGFIKRLPLRPRKSGFGHKAHQHLVHLLIGDALARNHRRYIDFGAKCRRTYRNLG